MNNWEYYYIQAIATLVLAGILFQFIRMTALALCDFGL